LSISHWGIERMDVLGYIDPGSGSLIIQAVIATIVAVPFFFRQQIGRIIRAARRGQRESPGQGTPPTDRAS
jgi:hypothetical protein